VVVVVLRAGLVVAVVVGAPAALWAAELELTSKAAPVETRARTTTAATETMTLPLAPA
jgi:hypothetical protein